MVTNYELIYIICFVLSYLCFMIRLYILFKYKTKLFADRGKSIKWNDFLNIYIRKKDMDKEYIKTSILFNRLQIIGIFIFLIGLSFFATSFYL